MIPKKADIKKATAGSSSGYAMGKNELNYIQELLQKMGGPFAIDLKSAQELFEYTGSAKPDTFVANAQDFLSKNNINDFHLGQQEGGKYVKFKPGARPIRKKKETPDETPNKTPVKA